MRKLFFLIFCAFVLNASYSQSKVGTVDLNFIISKMPELSGIQENLKTYGTDLDKQLQGKLEVYQNRLDSYNANIESLSEAQMISEQTEILNLEQEITKFQQNGVQLMRIKEDELKRPLFQKISLSLEKLAQAGNFSQVLSIDDNNTVVYLDPNLDLTLTILEDLGITVEN
ncbi:MAG: OmpH family outer membrane protein [Flavobacteriales bacterium]|nr:OmpH family outer membrane protein [Flavobacteriales bacterium]